MNLLIPLGLGVVALSLGSVLGYYARQSIAKRQIGTIEEKIQKRVDRTKQETEKLLREAKEKASLLIEKAQKEEGARRQELLKTGRLLLQKENNLDKKFRDVERKERDFQQKLFKVQQIKKNLEDLRKEAVENLAKVANLSKNEAKKELIKNIEKEYELEVLGKMKKLEEGAQERFERRAKELLSLAIQKCAINQAQEITTSTVALPSQDIKGRIIGKEGRNIRAFERLSGVEVLIDDTPDTVVLSAFDPVRRQIAKVALERLIQDGRIQPARIEEIISKSESEIASQIKEAGETAIYDTGVVGLHPKLVNVLGRLKFRTSYGQNVLLHSIEVSHLAGALAAELQGKVALAKKAGLLHDIGKAVDHKIQGSHTDIGIKILEKFGIEQEVIEAMKSHHEEYPYSGLESVLVQVTDQISGARPGARKDTLENYLKRLEDLEAIAASFDGVDKAYAIQAGREIRVLANSDMLTDLGAKKLAKQIASRVQEELKYPGEIKVNVIRETRVIEYAK